MNDETNNLLREVIRWLRFANLERAQSEVKRLLDTDKKRKVFESTDGTGSSRSVAASTKVDRNTIMRWWSDWFEAGILTREGESYRRLFSLKELGIKASEETTENH